MTSWTAHKVNGKPVAAVYDMSHTKALYVRVKNTGQKGWAKKAAGTPDLDKAKDIAYKWWAKRELELEAGYQLVGKPFSEAAEAFLEHYKSRAEAGFEKYALRTHKEKLELVNRYFVPHFGETAIDRIGKVGIEDYLKWRMTYWEKRIAAGDDEIRYERGGKTLTRKVKEGRPSPATIKRENATLKQIFDYAVEEGWLSADKKPKVFNIGTKTGRRPAFKRLEIEDVINAAIDRTADKTLNRKIRYQRQQLSFYIQFLYYTGIRPGEEANSMKWKDADGDKDSTLTGKVRYLEINTEREGKTEGSDRKVVPRNELWWWLDGYRKNHAIYCMDDDYIFADYDNGEVIHSFKKAFSALLSDIKLTHNARGIPFSLYSLRHSYASHNIKELGPWLVARNMGHSDVKMLEKHYAQESTVDLYPDD